jgi:hypothetical protein
LMAIEVDLSLELVMLELHSECVTLNITTQRWSPCSGDLQNVDHAGPEGRATRKAERSLLLASAGLFAKLEPS